jgi:3-oxoadipate enol-lactonase
MTDISSDRPSATRPAPPDGAGPTATSPDEPVFPRPELPPGRRLALPGRGTTFVRELAGPDGAPTVLLLHGWTATADLNFFRCYEPLARHYRVVALDHRGHGRGIRSRDRFSLEDCADDAAAVIAALGVDRALVVGYSMGGAVAQLVWRRHAPVVSGLVLCSTAATFNASRGERVSFLGLSGLATISRATPEKARRWLSEQLYLQRKADTWEPWALHEVGSHEWRAILEAGGAIGGFSSAGWLGAIDVPAAVVVTMRDRVVSVRRQIALFEGIADVEAFRVDGDHDAVVSVADRYVPTLLRACESVVRRGR